MLNLLWQSRFEIEKARSICKWVSTTRNMSKYILLTLLPNQFDDTESMFVSIKGETNGKLSSFLNFIGTGTMIPSN